MKLTSTTTKGYNGFIGTEENVAQLIKDVEVKDETFTYLSDIGSATGELKINLSSELKRPHFDIHYSGEINPLKEILFSPFKKIEIKTKARDIKRIREEFNLKEGYKFIKFECLLKPYFVNRTGISSGIYQENNREYRGTSIITLEEDINDMKILQRNMRRLGFVEDKIL